MPGTEKVTDVVSCPGLLILAVAGPKICLHWVTRPAPTGSPSSLAFPTSVMVPVLAGIPVSSPALTTGGLLGLMGSLPDSPVEYRVVISPEDSGRL